MTTRIDLHSEQDTIDLAYYLGPILKPGSIITLAGELGSGKTFFVKALGAFLGISEQIVSPSFILFKEYHGGRFPLYHLDLYRLKKEEELLELGILDLIETGITVIEWPEIAENYLPYQTLRLYFGFDNDHRFVEINPADELKQFFT